jgi:hypothetical protein
MLNRDIESHPAEGFDDWQAALREIRDATVRVGR